MKLFALAGSEGLGAAVARHAGIELDAHEERVFEDGEHKARPLVSVRGEDVYILASLAGRNGISANDQLIRLLFFVATCRENGARRITAVVPYLAYARKDRQTKPRDPVTTRYVAQLFEAMGTDLVVTLDAHNLSAFQNAFRCRTVHLDTRHLFATRIAEMAGERDVTVFSPDAGGVKRAELLRETLEALTGRPIGIGFMQKRRSAGEVSGDLFAGDVGGTQVFLVDDMISTGGTMRRAAAACRARGASGVHALAAHGLFSQGAKDMLTDPAIDGTWVTDSLAPFALSPDDPGHRLGIVSIAPLLAGAISRLSRGGSIRRLLEGEG
ncbi:MAG TPA: ribose-phosphate diphosphokinase [Devosiaceae bacterium]